MQWVPRVIPLLVGIVALDFTLVFGIEAFRILASPIAGLDQPAFARVIYALGKIAQLGPDGNLMLATMFGAVYLAIAVMFGLHLASRVQALRGGVVSHDLLDAALILAVISTLVAATPAILHGATEILVLQRLPLWLVGLAATLSMIERLPEMNEAKPAGFWERKLTRMLMRREQDDTTYVTPAVRENGQNMRWNDLRSEAGMKLCADLSKDLISKNLRPGVRRDRHFVAGHDWVRLSPHQAQRD